MKHKIVIGLGYGDEGKGLTVARLCEEQPATAVVRFNGGAQAAHNVTADDGRHHTFAQFGAGTFTPGVRTFLSSCFLLDVPALHAENAHLRGLGITDALARLTVSADAAVITPYLIEMNRAKERARGQGRHGSTGRGIGETAGFAAEHPDQTLRAGHLRSPKAAVRRLEYQREWLLDQFPDAHVPDSEVAAQIMTAMALDIRLAADDAQLRELEATTDRLVFEGAQGVLLDENYGFFPNVTRSTTTAANALALIGAAGLRQADVVGVTRTYFTRHGAGPFVTEDASLASIDDDHNGAGEFQGSFRRGHLDLAALRYAVSRCHVDELAVTHADVADRFELRAATAVEPGYDPGCAAEDLRSRARHTALLAKATWTAGGDRVTPELIASALGLPLVMTGYGPRIGDVRIAALTG